MIAGIKGFLPLVGTVDSGNKAVDWIGASFGNLWNAVASVPNAVLNYANNLCNAVDNALTQLDDLIPNEYSMTGSGLKEDIYVTSLFVGMNGPLVAESIYNAQYLPSYVNAMMFGGNSNILDDILANGNLLAGKNPAEIEKLLGDNPGWNVETLGKGSHAGQGWVYREYGQSGEATGRMIRYHPGGGHHGEGAYWRVNAGHGQGDIIPGG